MEFIIFLLILTIAYIFYKVKILNSYMVVTSITHSMLIGVLINKKLISKNELDLELNKIIGDLPEVDGNKIIKHAKSVGINIPNYMNEDEMEEYLKKKSVERAKTGDFSDFI